jgi:ferredoxin-thioredoxin reductase catalytic subunit
MHPSHQGITVEMPEFKKFALGLDESIGNEKRQWVTGEAAHAWSAGVREGIIGDQNDPLHTVRSGAAGVAGVGTGLATTPSMIATVGMVGAMESPTTMAKIGAGGVGRFVGSTGRYIATDPTGAISELGTAAVVGSYGPRAVGALRTRVPVIQTRPFALSQRVVESRPFRLAERAYQTSQVSRDQMGATWTALKMGERIRDLDVAPRNSADTILGWMPDSLKAGIRSGLQKTDGQHLITGEAPMKFALGDAGMPATELHRAMGDKFTPDDELVEELLDAELKFELDLGAPYCPCQMRTGERAEDMRIVCPCIPFHRKHFDAMRRCWCGLFVHRDVTDPSTLPQFPPDEE